MKKVVSQLEKSVGPVKPLNIDVEKVMHNVIDLSVTLHELVHLGLSYDQIKALTEALHKKDKAFTNEAIDIILGK